MSLPANATLGTFRVPEIDNEPLRTYGPNTPERAGIRAALQEIRSQAPIEIPVLINGEKVCAGQVGEQHNPSDHKKVLARYYQADDAAVDRAIAGALAAKPAWESSPFQHRVAVFLKAADLLAGKYRYKIMAATMLGQGKNIWQAEIDAAAELVDFLRFNALYAQEIYQQQPPKNAPGVWNRVECRPLEGFVYAITPFNFTAIAGNLPAAPALMGNVVVWKPSPYAMLSNWYLLEILREAGLPDGVIQFVPGDAEKVTARVLASPDFAALHFTGSTAVFKNLWKNIGNNIGVYRSYPRIVGETGGKNFHMIHHSANVMNAVQQTIRGAFEYQGQKCSACSRAYVPECMWKEFQEGLKRELLKIKVGSVEELTNFMGPVIHEASFNKIHNYIEWARSDPSSHIIAGGKCDKSTGYFVEPTVIATKDPKSKTMVEEIFGPVLTIYVYPEKEYIQTLDLVNESSSYGLTGALFAQDRTAIVIGETKLRHAAGNFYINDKSTGAIVGQQPFGGSRGSGTNDKAGSATLLYRFISMRSIKENFINLEGFAYPSNHPDTNV